MNSPSQIPTVEELVARARSLVPRLRAEAAATEQRRTASPGIMRELFALGLLRYFQPKRFGGWEMDWGTQFHIGRALAQGCSSTAWVATVVGAHTCYAARHRPETQEEIWADGPDVLIATGSVQKSGRAEKVPGGYRVNGAWGFASGVDYAHWGQVAVRIEGESEVLQMMLPRKDFIIDDVWHVAGMKGTGTKDINVQNAFVPDHRALKGSLFHGLRPPGHAVNPHYIYGMEFRPASGSSLLGPILGTAEAALDQYIETTKLKKAAIMGNRPAHNPAVQMRLSESAAEINAARLIIEIQFALLNKRGKALEAFTDEERTSITRDRAFAMRLCYGAVQRLVNQMGALGVFDDNPVQRCFRDLHVMSTQFGVSWDVNMPGWGAYTLGVSPGGAH